MRVAVKRGIAATAAAVLVLGWVGTAASASTDSEVDRGLRAGPAASDQADERESILPAYLTEPFADALGTAGHEIDEDGYPTSARVITAVTDVTIEEHEIGGAPWDTPLAPDDPNYDLAAELNLLAEWWRPVEVWAEGPPAPAQEASDLAAQLAEAGITVTAEGWVHPLPNGKFVSGFGPRGAIRGVIGAGFHAGVDLAAPLGYPIRAAAEGTVTYVGNGSRQYGLSGWVVVVDHGDGVVTSYNHMSRAGVLVNEGDEVGAGQIVALVGSEGRSSGPHLHFGVYVNGKAVDPYTFMLSRGIDLKSGRTVTPVPLTQDWLAAQEQYRRQAQSPQPDPAPTTQAPPASPSPSPSEPSAPAPSPAEPQPSESPSEPEPSASPSEPGPSPSEPAPSPSEPTPTPSEPTPTPTEPTPTPTEPTPTPTEPTPSPSEPAPTPTESEPPDQAPSASPSTLASPTSSASSTP